MVELHPHRAADLADRDRRVEPAVPHPQVVEQAQRLAGEVADLGVGPLALELGDHDHREDDLVLLEPAQGGRVREQDARVEDVGTALREEDFAVAIPLAERFTDGVQAVIDRHGLPWNVQRLGCRAEYWFCPPPRDGAAAAAAVDEELERLMHLWALNRGVLLTPFHNMALFSPAHSEADVDRHTEVFGAAVDALLG